MATSQRQTVDGDVTDVERQHRFVIHLRSTSQPDAAFVPRDPEQLLRLAIEKTHLDLNRVLNFKYRLLCKRENSKHSSFYFRVVDAEDLGDVQTLVILVDNNMPGLCVSDARNGCQGDDDILACVHAELEVVHVGGERCVVDGVRCVCVQYYNFV